jgi:hypothetical protein
MKCIYTQYEHGRSFARLLGRRVRKIFAAKCLPSTGREPHRPLLRKYFTPFLGRNLFAAFCNAPWGTGQKRGEGYDGSATPHETQGVHILKEFVNRLRDKSDH